MGEVEEHVQLKLLETTEVHTDARRVRDAARNVSQCEGSEPQSAQHVTVHEVFSNALLWMMPVVRVRPGEDPVWLRTR